MNQPDNDEEASVKPEGLTFEDFIRAVFGKPKLVIRRTSCACGGQWAWYLVRQTVAIPPETVMEGQGCVCHHPWTLVLRGGASSIPEAVALILAGQQPQGAEATRG